MSENNAQLLFEILFSSKDHYHSLFKFLRREIILSADISKRVTVPVYKGLDLSKHRLGMQNPQYREAEKAGRYTSWIKACCWTRATSAVPMLFSIPPILIPCWMAQLRYKTHLDIKRA